MKTVLFLLLATISLLTTGIAGQQSTTAPSATSKDKQKQDSPSQKNEGVVRISVTLVQVDVSVTDKKGRPVNDLKPEDFKPEVKCVRAWPAEGYEAAGSWRQPVAGWRPSTRRLCLTAVGH
jgi:hypothetical protein